MPPQPSSSYADEGTLLHDAIAKVLETDCDPFTLVGTKLNDSVLTEDLIENKLLVALSALDEIDPEGDLIYQVESRVGFANYTPEVFGSADLIGSIGRRAIVLDWKFGNGVPVEAEENYQLMFYAAAAIRTPATSSIFHDVDDIELIIVQPPSVKRWVTTRERIFAFESDLFRAINTALKPNAPLASGDHCRWCAAKPICPVMTGAIDRITKAKIEVLPVDQIAHYLDQVPLVEAFIKDLQQLAHGLIEEGKAVPGWKLVNKRATRQWIDEDKAVAFLSGVGVEAWGEPKPLSPAQAEKALKKAKIELPDDLVVAVSTGSTLAPENDPRPAVLQIGHSLKKAMAKLQ
jgi:hypothetical protein